MEGMYGLVLFFGFLSGCGIATFSVGIGQTSYWFPQKKQGMALGTYAGLGNLAPGLFSLILPIYLEHYGFISAYFAWFLFLLIGTVIFGLIGYNADYFQYRKAGYSREEAKQHSKAKGQEIFPSGGVKDSLKNSAKIKNTWALVVLYFTTFGGFIALTAWFPTYWSEFQAFSPVKAGVFTAIFALLASGIRVPGGSLADKMGGERVAMLAMLLVLIAAVILFFTHTVILGITAAVILAVGMGVNNAAVFKLVPVYVPKSVGGAAGWVGGLGAFGGFAIPPVMGTIADIYGKAGYAKGFLVFALLALLNLVVIYALMKNKKN
ncbi:MAG: MFS transporter [Bacteroidales bacterium]|nr:MFS transporter [Bacteroidales bacterium]